MSSFFRSSYALFLLLQGCTIASAGSSSGFFPPVYKEVITARGATATFQWRYYIALADAPRFREIIWGLWSSYQPHPKLITVLATTGEVIPNPRLSTAAPSYSGRILWKGNLNSSLIQFVLKNVSLSDQRKYGCFLVVGYLWPMIKSSLDLSVAEKAHKHGFIKHQHKLLRSLLDGYIDLDWSFRVPSSLRNKLSGFTLALWDKQLQVFRNVVTRTETAEIWSAGVGAKFKGRLYWNGDLANGSAKFRLYRLTAQDELRLYCIAHFDNPKRLFYASTQILVEVAAVITNITGNVTVDEGKAFVLYCEALGTPNATVSWFAKGKRLTLQSENSTIKQNATRDDEGWYECQASNDAGGRRRTATKLTFLEVKFEPLPPVITKVDPTPSSVKVSWKSTDREKGRKILSFLIHIWTDEEGKSNGTSYTTKLSSYVIHRLKGNTNYSILVYAESSSGYGPPSHVETFRTPYVGRPDTPVIINNKSSLNEPYIVLRWTKPFNGGSAITHYTVRFREVTTGRNQTWIKMNASRTDHAQYLERGREYEFAVTAWNIYGESIIDENQRRFILRIADRTTNHVQMVLTRETTRPTTEPKTAIEVPEKREESFTKTWLLNGVLIASLCLVTFLLVFFTVWSKFRTRRYIERRGKEVAILEEGLLAEQRPPATHVQKSSVLELEADGVYTIPYLPDIWELPREDLIVKSIFGRGAFGQVARGFVRGINGAIGLTEVAVKMLREDADDGDRADLLSELEIMKKLRPHPNVIKLIGCITKCANGPMVIVEFASNGDLLGFLRKSRGLEDPYYNTVRRSLSLTAKDLLKFAKAIASGMSHLSASGIVHRDLAARNVLVSKHQVCKVTDFGMSRNLDGQGMYRMKAGSRLPIKWTSLESLFFQEYTTQSDVWSFGVVLYEIFTLGGTPYPDIAPFDLLPMIKDGYRMPKPHHIDKRLYTLMLQCWQDEPSKRPTFLSLCSTLKSFAGYSKDYIQMDSYQSKDYLQVDNDP